MGLAAELEFKAQMGLSTTMPYIRPPLIHARFTGRIKESKRCLLSKKLNEWTLGRFQKPINALLKGALYLAIWFSRHHYLTVRELSWRACQLALEFVRFFCSIIVD